VNDREGSEEGRKFDDRLSGCGVEKRISGQAC
jgi:hypothetical protein